jgi:hypothetical protein
MADDSLLPLSGDEKLALVAGLKRLIDEDHCQTQANGSVRAMRY